MSAESISRIARGVPEQERLSFGVQEEPHAAYEAQGKRAEVTTLRAPEPTVVSPAQELLTKVREILQHMEEARTDTDVATDLDITRAQAKAWLERLVKEGVLEKLSKPVRYRCVKGAERL